MIHHSSWMKPPGLIRDPKRRKLQEKQLEKGSNAGNVLDFI